MDVPQRKRLRLAADLYAEPGRAFSVTIGTAPRLPVFADLDFGMDCVALLKRHCVKTATRCYAYCLMPDHAHLLVGVGLRTPLSTFVGTWKSLCGAARRRRGGSGQFWQRSFFDRAVRDNEALDRTALYILANPIRAGLTKDLGDYALAGSFEFSVVGAGLAPPDK